MSVSKQSSFRKSQICLTVCFTCLQNSVLGCSTSAIQPSRSLAATVLSSSLVGVTCIASILPAAVTVSAPAPAHSSF